MDSSDRERIGDSREELEGILEDSEMKGMPFVVLANKQDMQNAMSSLELIENLGLRKYNGRHEWHVEATCAVTGEGIDEAMDMIGKLAKQRKVWLRLVCENSLFVVWRCENALLQKSQRNEDVRHPGSILLRKIDPPSGLGNGYGEMRTCFRTLIVG